MKERFFRFPQISAAITADGCTIGAVGSEQRLCTQFRQIGRVMISALLAAEDKRFFQHRGVDPLAVIRAALRNIQRLKFVQGGSTITQQLVRNFVLRDGRRTLWRKLREALWALVLETRLTKEDILEAYLNGVCFGHGVYGVRLASLRTFAKEPNDLSREEACYLAGLLRGPAIYCRCCHPDRAERRTQQVLRLQSQLHDSEPADAHVTRTRRRWRPRPMLLDLFPRTGGYFLSLVSHSLKALVPDHYPTEPLIVTTTLHVRCQLAVETVCRELAVHGLRRRLACVVQDAASGDIWALAGGLDHRLAPFDTANNGRLQPGSVVKPFVLAAALDAGLSLQTTYPSVPLTIPVGRDRTWTVRNYNGIYRGQTTLAQALAQSDNAVFAQLILDLGPENIARLLRRLGIEVEAAVPALALGAVRPGVSPLQISDAYSVFSNPGTFFRHRAVLSVRTEDGHELLTDRLRQGDCVPGLLPKETCLKVRHALRLAAERGTSHIRAAGGPLHAKTGTAPGGAWYLSFDETFRVLTWLEEAPALSPAPLPGKATTARALAERLWTLLRRPELTSADLTGSFRGVDRLGVRDLLWLEEQFS